MWYSCLSIYSFSPQAEGKVDNYTDLADIGPYPAKKAPQERVQYTEVTPSDVSVVCVVFVYMTMQPFANINRDE